MSPPDPPLPSAPLADVFPPGSFAGLTRERPGVEPTEPPGSAGPSPASGLGLDLSLFAGMRSPAPAPAPEAAPPVAEKEITDGPLPLLESDDGGVPRGFAETSFSLQKLAASLVDGPTPAAREAVRPTAVPLPAVEPFPVLEKSAPSPPVPSLLEAEAPPPQPEIVEATAQPERETVAAVSPFPPAGIPATTTPVASPFLPAKPAPVAAPLHVESPFLDSPAFQPPAPLPLPHSLFLPFSPAAPGFAVAPASGAEPSAPAAPDSSAGLIIGGTVLVLGGTALACLVPLRILEILGLSSATGASEVWARQSAEFSLIPLAAGAVSCLGLGIGSAAMRRWAPPLIHAAAWVAVLFTLFLLSGATAAIFHAEDTAALPAGPLVWLAGAGLAVPLALIAHYQRDRVAAVCAAMDPGGRPVPPTAVPAGMVIVSSLALALLSAAMLRHQPAFPWFGEIRVGENASVAWVSCAAFFGFTALLAAARSAAGWWLLLAGTLALGVNAVLTFRALPFPDFLTKLGRPAADALPPLPGPVDIWIILPFLPLLLILLMSRRAFADSSSDPSLS